MPSRRSTASFGNVGYWALRIQPSSALSVYAATGTTAETAGRVVKLPRMQLERQFAGPLQDTIIQRWRDPVDGTICYIYLPITAAHSPPTASGYVQYRLDKLPRGRSGRRGTRRGGPPATKPRPGTGTAAPTPRTSPSPASPPAPPPATPDPPPPSREYPVSLLFHVTSSKPSSTSTKRGLLLQVLGLSCYQTA